MGGRFLNNYRLLGTTLYVTLEPCIMCVGAILNARIYRLVYGAADKKKIKYSDEVYLKNILRGLIINNRILVTDGILENECSVRLNNFFVQKRKKFRSKKILKYL